MCGNDGRVLWNHSLNRLKQKINPNKVMQQPLQYSQYSEVMKLILEHLINSQSVAKGENLKVWTQAFHSLSI